MLSRRALLIAFHYPPMAGSSGIQRTQRFAQYLPDFGWSPIVLSARPSAYVETSQTTDSTAPAAFRAVALDTARHLSIRGRYPDFLARPDRWISWLFGAVPLGLALIWRFRPQIIWSTYPIATAHLIADRLHGITGIPWVADFRDPMAHDGYPADPKTWRSFARIEQRVFAAADEVVFTTSGTRDLYARRFESASSKLHIIANGYDEDSFGQAERASPALAQGTTPTLLHSGVVYPEWRNPVSLFKAIKLLADGDDPAYRNVRVRFRGSAHDAFLHRMAHEVGVSDQVEIVPQTPYVSALREMLDAQGLLLLQSAGCNDQIPAKLYEYMRARRPIIALTDLNGDTARQVRDIGGAHLVAPDDVSGIAQALRSWMDEQRWRTEYPLSDQIAAHSRRAGTARLATIFDNLLERRHRHLR
jgi:glycosyltransferase involved in cell wall biosynthesis